MKYIIYSLASIIIISFSSCDGNSGENDQKSEITISIDSALVDAKGEIIDTKFGIYSFGFDDNKDFMYKFNTNNRHGLEIIDMNKLELVDFIPFEVEGPNGTTNRVNDVYFISEDKIALVVYQAILIFNRKGELQEKYIIRDEEFEGDSIPKEFSMEASGLFVPEENISFNLVNEGYGYVRGFSKIDLRKKIRKVVFINDLKKLSDYHISLTIDGRMMMLRTYLYTNFQDDKYILSHDMENELYYYDLKSDSIIHKKYTSQLSANKNQIFGKDVDSREEIGKIMTARNKAIRFKKLVYDKNRNQYYRFSSFSTTPDQEDENWNIILTIFDENLNQINEIENIDLDEVPETYFVKNGKIYIYKNMEDEMGFKILSINED
ncbi:DUF4221 family protein [Marivirga harenae]|uniref:DUF4221 family protein n=1 Tax=Marivirga harenae TaxID=2010992 RepID=UPI0026DEEEEC|nr:DUF4221 family protein [Marivirga harenae]WKV13772.1 DUF4221 family protein [Marivirga harenae]|tara:strand:- start:69885 stop:71018 length:1134 start_codon:yes stop_codon:yes gene_type:complete